MSIFFEGQQLTATPFKSMRWCQLKIWIEKCIQS